MTVFWRVCGILEGRRAMKKFECLVEKEALANPVCIATFKKDGTGNAGSKRAELLMEHLERLRIKFAAEESDSLTEIFVAPESLDD